MFKPKHFLDQTAFYVGYRDFKKGKIDAPNFKGYSILEWHRGFNYAYFLNLERVKQREKNRFN